MENLFIQYQNWGIIFTQFDEEPHNLEGDFQILRMFHAVSVSLPTIITTAGVLEVRNIHKKIKQKQPHHQCCYWLIKINIKTDTHLKYIITNENLFKKNKHN